MKRPEKKSESLDIRLPYEQKQAFMKATRERGETASQALRRFISDYVEETRLAAVPNPVKEMTMTVAKHRFKTLAATMSAAVGMFALTALPSAAEDGVFDKLDKNKDGVLTVGEIVPGKDADVIEVLDKDQSGDVSRDEFYAAGNRIVIAENTSSPSESENTVQQKRLKVLQFTEDDGTFKLSDDTKRSVIIRRTSDDPLNPGELNALVQDAIEEAGLTGSFDVDVEALLEAAQD